MKKELKEPFEPMEMKAMRSAKTLVNYWFTEANYKKVNELLKDAQKLRENDFYAFQDLLYQIYGVC